MTLKKSVKRQREIDYQSKRHDIIYKLKAHEISFSQARLELKQIDIQFGKVQNANSFEHSKISY